MQYFSDLEFGFWAHVPHCNAWIDRQFPFYALNYCSSGSIRWQDDTGGECELVAPVAWRTVPDVWYRYGCSPDRFWDQRFVTFTGRRAERMLDEGLLTDAPYVPVADGDRFRRGWDDLFVALDSGGRENPEAIQRLEQLLLILHEPELCRDTMSVWKVPLETLGQAIRERPARLWDWEREASKLAVSAVHLRRLFKSQFGQSPHQFLISARLERALQLLNQTNLPVKAVGAEVGITDPYHFSKLFRERFHLPPGQYRESVRLLYGQPGTLPGP